MLKLPEELYHKKILLLEKANKELKEENECLWLILDDVQAQMLTDKEFKKIFDKILKRIREEDLRKIEIKEVC